MKLKELGNILKLPLGGVGFFAGIAFFVPLVMALFFHFESYFKEIGDYRWWLLVVSFIVLVAGGFYFIDGLLKRKKFKELAGTKKRSEFIKNEKEIEKLVLALPAGYREKVRQRKKEFRIRDKDLRTKKGKIKSKNGSNHSR
jgi:hypothetical protein